MIGGKEYIVVTIIIVLNWSLIVNFIRFIRIWFTIAYRWVPNVLYFSTVILLEIMWFSTKLLSTNNTWWYSSATYEIKWSDSHSLIYSFHQLMKNIQYSSVQNNIQANVTLLPSPYWNSPIGFQIYRNKFMLCSCQFQKKLLNEALKKIIKNAKTRIRSFNRKYG